jgi:hypothetical protein
VSEVVIGKRELRRPYNFDTLRDIVPDETPRLPRRNNGDLAVTFDVDLTPEQVTAIRLRLTTASDAEAVQVVALAEAADAARAWEVPPAWDSTPVAAASVMSFVSRKAAAGVVASNVAEGDPDADQAAALAALAAQVEWLTMRLADLTDYVLGN